MTPATVEEEFTNFVNGSPVKGSSYQSIHMAELTFTTPVNSSRQLKRLFWILLILNLAFIAWFRMFLDPLTTKEIVRFEIAKTLPVAQGIITAWSTPDNTLLQTALDSIYLDYIFIVLYTAGLSVGCMFLSELTQHTVLKRAGTFLPVLIVVAGVCDVIENVAMTRTLRGELNEFNVIVAYDMAVTKFSIVILSLLFMCVCLVFYIARIVLPVRKFRFKV